MHIHETGEELPKIARKTLPREEEEIFLNLLECLRTWEKGKVSQNGMNVYVVLLYGRKTLQSC
jgi:hypothetical protein